MALRTPSRRRTGMRSRIAAALSVAALLVLAGPALAASATDSVQLGAGYVLDDAGVLSSSEASAAQQRLEQFREDSGLDLYVVYVDEFTNPTDSADWADTTADQNGLGPSQYLLAIATDTRQLWLSYDTSGPVSDDQIGAIVQDRIIPALRDDDWAGAVDAAASGLASAAGGGSGGAGDGGSGVFTIVLIVIVVIVAVVLLIVLLRRRRKKAGAPVAVGAAAAPQMSIEELARAASTALVDTDDAVRTSEQELGFAVAQFGEAATAEFSAALATARENLTHAFTLKQQLDDSTPDTDEQIRDWNTQIIQLCEEANAGLDDKSADFDELRKLEADAPAALERVRAERESAASGIDGASAVLQTLRGTYAPEALATVDDNVDQARERLAFADAQLAEAQTALTAGDGGEAAVGIRAAEEAVGQATMLEKAIESLGTDLAAGEQQAAQVIAGLEQDMRTAAQLPDPDGRVAATVERTRQTIAAAQADLAGGAKRPLHALQGLQSADQEIDAVVAQIRDAAEQAQRVGQQLDGLMSRAQAQVSTAESFIVSRRGAVGTEARTRFAEAGAALVRAQQLRDSDPARALQEAQRADQLAGQAIQYAQTDVSGFSAGGMGGFGGGGGGGSGFMGALLGGIVGSAISGGGSSRGSSGFGGFGGLSGGSSRGRSGGGFRSGSFGGGGTRGRRGGGRF